MNQLDWPGFESRTYCFQDRRAYEFGHQASSPIETHYSRMLFIHLTRPELFI